MSGAEFGTPQDLAAAYALGALDDAEAKAFEALLARDADLAREVAEYREVAALLALAQPAAAAPSDALRARVLAGAPQRQASVTPLRTPGSTWMPWALAAALLLAAWMGAGRARLGAKLDQMGAMLAQRDTALAERDTRHRGPRSYTERPSRARCRAVPAHRQRRSRAGCAAVLGPEAQHRHHPFIRREGASGGPCVSTLVHPGWEAGSLDHVPAGSGRSRPGRGDRRAVWCRGDRCRRNRRATRRLAPADVGDLPGRQAVRCVVEPSCSRWRCGHRT